jgi:hypothetical protein
MVSPHPFRLTLGHSMVIIALSALFLAAIAYGIRGSFGFLAVLITVVGCAGLGVFVYNLRLSGWLWLVIVGYAEPTLLNNLAVVLLGPGSAAYPTLMLGNQLIMSSCSVVGFAMTFRDIRRRLATGASAA